MIATIFRYTKLLAWFGIYRYYPSDIVEDFIVKNINDCGCVIIKFFQWISPIIEMSSDSDKIFPPKKLDTIYENCNYHSINYTKYIRFPIFISKFITSKINSTCSTRVIAKKINTTLIC